MQQTSSISSFNKTIKRIISVIAVIAILAVMIRTVSPVFARKLSERKYTDFIEQKADFDVLFFGSSHVINGVYPMELWKKFGIVSYNFGGHSLRVPTEYWVMRNALQYTKPRLVVMDCWEIETNEKYEKPKHVHTMFDTFPLTKLKLEAVRDLFPNDKLGQLEIIWPYSTYHARWNDLEREDFEYDNLPNKGAQDRINIEKGADMPQVAPDDMFEGETLGTEYLCRTIEYCQENGIDILLTYLPLPATEDQQRGAHRAREIAEQYGVDYINFLDMDVIDPEIDYCDEEHVNPAGAIKLTDYLGQYIQDNYDIEDRRDDPDYSSWNEDYRTYAEYKKGNFLEEENLGVYLMLAEDTDYDKELRITNPQIYDNEMYMKLLSGMGFDEEILADHPEYLLLQDGHTSDEDRYGLAGVEGMDLSVVLVDKKTGEQIDRAGFTVQTKNDVPDDAIITTGVFR